MSTLIAMSTLNVHLFGRISIWKDKVMPVSLCNKLEYLLCYLLLKRGRPHSREYLATLLWADSTTAQSKKYLRHALWQLQAALKGFSQDQILLIDDDWVDINMGESLWIDVAVFEQAFLAVQGISGFDLDQERAAALESAVELYRGDLMEGVYHDWCLLERDRLQSIYLAMLDKLMAYCEAHKEYEAGLAYGSRVLVYDQAREHSYCRMMRLHYLAGNRTAPLCQRD